MLQLIQTMEKAINIPLAPADEEARRSMQIELLKKMEDEKAQIDERAEAQVRRELWAGLVFMMAQTVGFMRLTFWELSWDVMEPICFFVTSLYFMAGYAFFLRTSRDPSFEAIFHVRFLARQRRLISLHNFDIHRFHHLRRMVAGRRITSD